MNTVSRTITGIASIVLGVYFTYIGFLNMARDWPVLIWGLAFAAIGIFILFNKKEDDIEKIKNSKN